MAQSKTIYNKLIKFWNKIIYPPPPQPPYAHIVQLGDPCLRKKSEPVDLDKLSSDYIQNVIGNLKHIMVKSNLPGLSAIQIGCPFRIFGIQFPDPSSCNEFSEEEIKGQELEQIPLQIWINPEISIIDGKQKLHKEYCGSTIGYSANVKRYKCVRLTGYDELGTSKTIEATGNMAGLIQHEMDHVNGIMFTDIMDLKSLHCIHWHTINYYRGRLKLSYVPKR